MRRCHAYYSHKQSRSFISHNHTRLQALPLRFLPSHDAIYTILYFNHFPTYHFFLDLSCCRCSNLPYITIRLSNYACIFFTLLTTFAPPFHGFLQACFSVIDTFRFLLDNISETSVYGYRDRSFSAPNNIPYT